MAVTAAIVGTAVALGSTGYGVSKDQDAKKVAHEAREDQRDERSKLEEEARIKEQQQAASAEQQKARRRQVASLSSNYGRASTILTGPQGLGGNTEYTG